MTDLRDHVGIYLRRSTDDHSEEHQVEDIREWLDHRDLSLGDVEVYRDGPASGASADRDTFDDSSSTTRTAIATDRWGRHTECDEADPLDDSPIRRASTLVPRPRD
ncbi:hypothetical protein C482_00205 [Natrialba chahannaoensis JCM 10990]|uniref:Resolvase/invertase-type recombinase catalytic domain-containing protein n=1 Tax=Natrialba chahannaoensis JCM 10990 TaxID=1227492 RepID=M0B6Q3_9EURY|nr:recombinase family protein [Natrialba chahannaoensis]ELZ06197.1 hypothetical protein C482_00205 [Natrialba chahannaoensis JCM 10990]